MNINKIIDITRRVYPEMTIWPGDPGIAIHRDASIKDGSSCNVSSVNIGLHTGTHIDSPYHFIDDGKDIASLDLNSFIGAAKVFEINAEKCITAGDLEPLPIEAGDIVLFKTSNSFIPETSPFCEDFVYIDASAANLLVQRRIKTVGVDYLSVDAYSSKGDCNSSGYPAHHTLLSNNIGIIEGLYLKDVSQGEYILSCLPLRIEGVEGSPARAVLLAAGGV